MSEETFRKWIAEKAAHIRALKKPTEQQQMLLVLHDNSERDKAQERQYIALARAEKALERAQIARAKAAALLKPKKEKGANRKAEDARKILIGAAIQELVKKGIWKQEQLNSLMNKFLIRDRDRELFDLPPKQTQAQDLVEV